MPTTTKPPNNPAASLPALALQIAQSQVGEKEIPKGSNSGPMVNQYLQSTGLRPGFAWCQAFVYWCYEQAAIKLQQDNPMVKTGGVYNCWNKTPDTSKVLKAAVTKDPGLVQPGMQFVLLFGKGAGHTGIVVSFDPATLTFQTIEGNSNTDGSREGYEVVLHQRKLTEPALQGFLKY